MMEYWVLGNWYVGILREFIVDMGGKVSNNKGNLKQYILNLGEKWNNDLPCPPVMVFDREGSANIFYSKLVLAGSPFEAWQKNINTEQLAGIEDCKFAEPFEFNGKSYKVFEMD